MCGSLLALRWLANLLAIISLSEQVADSINAEIHKIRMGLSFGAVACGMDALAEWAALPDSRRTDANKVAMVYAAVRAASDHACSEGSQGPC